MDERPFNEYRPLSDVASEEAFVAPEYGETSDGPATGRVADGAVEGESLAEHHPTVEQPVPPIPSAIANEEISFIRERPDGKKVTTLGSILEDGHH